MHLMSDPFTVDDDDYDNFYLRFCYIGFFKLCNGFKSELNYIDYEIYDYNHMRYEDRVEKEDRIHWTQCVTLDYLFGSILIPESLIITKILNKSRLTNEEKHSKMLDALPQRIRRALPDVLKWNTSPYEFTDYQDYIDDIEKFSIDDEVSDIPWIHDILSK